MRARTAVCALAFVALSALLSLGPGEDLRAQDTPRPLVVNIEQMLERYPIRADEPVKAVLLVTGSDASVRVVQVHRLKKHFHTRSDEYVYVLRGKARVLIGDATYELNPGDFVFIPKGVPHHRDREVSWGIRPR